MSYYQSRGGDFATSPRGKVAENYDFIRSRAGAGVPLQHIANMVGCAVSDVQAVVGLPVLEALEPHVPMSTRSELAAIKRNPNWQRQGREEQWRAARAARNRAMPPRVKAIVQTIADQRGVELELLLGGRVLRGITLVRDEVCHALYMTGCFSFSQIGAFLGGRDHTSALNSVRNHGERLQADADLAAWKDLGKSEAA